MKMKYIKYVLSWVLLMVAAHVSAISVSVAPVNITAGQSSEIVISLDNTETNLTAYQMSLYLPEGVTLKKKANGKYDYTLSGRHESTHTLSIKDAADGSLLLVCSSMDKDVISGTSGELLRLPIDVASTVTTSLQAQLKNIIFSDVNSQKTYPSDITVNLLLSGEEPPVVNPDDISVTVSDVQITAGSSAEIIVNLTNSATNLTAYQMSLYLPEGVTLKKKANGKYDYTLSDRHESTHTLSIKDAADGSLLLVCSSLDKDVISGTSGELLRLPIDVASTVTTSLQAQLKSIIFSDVNSQKSYPSDVTFNMLLPGEEPPVVEPGDISVTVSDVQAKAGSSAEIIVNLTNTATNLTAYQMSLYLPEGVTLQKNANGKYIYMLSGRHESTHTLSIRDAADGSLLLVCNSMDKDVISGTSGELLRLPIDVALTVTTTQQAQLKTIIFSDVNSQKSYPSDVNFNIVVSGIVSKNITFADDNVKALCITNWDANHDGELSMEEAAAVTDLSGVFWYNQEITSFDELQYFVGLTAIADHAFAGCSALTSVKLPATVTHIYDAAFEDCGQLENVDFNGCKAVIHSQAFYLCRNLMSIVLPAETYPMGWSVFNECSGLTSFVMEPSENLQDVWCNDAFANCIALETATIYGNYFRGPDNFGNCSRLATVTFLNDQPGNSFHQNFQGVPASVQFVIPDGSAETFLQQGYINLSDKSALDIVRDEFETEANRIEKLSLENSTNVLANGNLESTDVSCFFSKEFPSEDVVPATIVDNEGVDASRGIAVTSTAGAANDYDTQFWVRLPKTLPAGTKFWLSFDYKASADVEISSEWHNEPGQYVHWDCLNLYGFTTSWQHYDRLITVPAECDGTDNGEFMRDFRSVAFTIAHDREHDVTYYFDNFRLVILEESPLLNAIEQSRAVVNNATEYADVFSQIAVIKDAARDFLATAELSGVVDVTGAYITNPDFDHFDIGWQAPSGWMTSGFQNGHCENGDIVTDKFIQIWRDEWVDDHSAGKELDDWKLSQNIAQLPAGTYRLEADCIASWITNDREITGAYLYIGDYQTAVATQHGLPQHYTVEFTLTEATDVELGMKTINTNANWIAADNFRLYSINNVLGPTDITELANAIYVESLTGKVGRSLSMDIKLKNDQPIRTYSFKLKLPQGVTIAKDDNGEFVYELSGRNVDYQPTLNYNSESQTYNFAVFSTVTGNDGTIITLKLQVSDDIAVGEYPVRITDGSFSLAGEYLSLPVPETTAMLNIQEKTFMRGDVNDDDEVDIADVVCVVNHVVELPVVKFVAAAADVNNDGNQDLTDALKIVDYLAGIIDVLAPAFEPEPFDSPAKAPMLMPDVNESSASMSPPADVADAFYAEDMTVKSGKDVPMAVCLKNSQDARGYSFDLVLPDGITLAKNDAGKYICELSDRQDMYTAVVSYKEDVRSYSVVVYTTTANVISSDDGVVCTLKLQAASDVEQGTYTVAIQNGKYSLVNGTKQTLPRAEVKLTVKNYIKGDANGDGGVTITDAVAIVNYILGNPSGNFNKEAANVNDDFKDNGEPNITITDAVGVVNIILNNGGASAPAFDSSEVEVPEATEPE